MNVYEQRESRCKALKDVQTATFACVETNLYLDTHPDDSEALAAMREYEKKRIEAVKKYEESFGPLFAYSVECGSDVYEWVKYPFPWEKEDRK